MEKPRTLAGTSPVSEVKNATIDWICWDLVDFAQDGQTRCNYLAKPKLVGDLLLVLRCLQGEDCSIEGFEANQVCEGEDTHGVLPIRFDQIYSRLWGSVQSHAPLQFDLVLDEKLNGATRTDCEATY